MITIVLDIGLGCGSASDVSRETSGQYSRSDRFLSRCAQVNKQIGKCRRSYAWDLAGLAEILWPNSFQPFHHLPGKASYPSIGKLGWYIEPIMLIQAPESGVLRIQISRIEFVRQGGFQVRNS